MLSVLIPTYNYATYELVSIVQKQCEIAQIDYEIIVQDDASTNQDSIQENELINDLDNCSFIQNEINLGRGKNRNTLVAKTNFEWLLFLDCDVKPKQENFINFYLEEIKNKDNKVIFGGICYKNIPPATTEILRWKYGKEREELSVLERNNNPYNTLLTSNILFHKSIFEKVSFTSEISQYGYEDLVFAKELEANKILVSHIENPVFHLNYETSEVFLQKTEKSLQTLFHLENQNILSNKTTKLQQIFQRLKWWKLDGIYFWFFKKWKKRIVSNLLSKNPSLFYFDLYKLGYFMILKSAK